MADAAVSGKNKERVRTAKLSEEKYYFIKVDGNPYEIKRKIILEDHDGKDLMDIIAKSGGLIDLFRNFVIVNQSLHHLEDWCNDPAQLDASPGDLIDDASVLCRIFLHEYKTCIDHMYAFVTNECSEQERDDFKKKIADIKMKDPEYQTTIQIRNYLQHSYEVVHLVEKNFKDKRVNPLLMPQILRPYGTRRWTEHRYINSHPDELNLLPLFIKAYELLEISFEPVVNNFISKDNMDIDLVYLRDYIQNVVIETDGNLSSIRSWEFALWKRGNYEARMYHWPSLMELVKRLSKHEVSAVVPDTVNL